jgi:cytochrome P450
MSLPPSPSQPSLVQRVQYLRDPIGYIEACERAHGDVFTLRLFKKGMVVVCSPELAKELYTTSDDILVAGEAKISIFGKLLGRSSVLLLDGPAHVKRRRLLLPRFKGELMRTFAPVMADACRNVFNDIPRYRAFPLHPFMHRIAFDVISVALFSSTPPHELEPLLATLREFANVAVTSRLLMVPALQIDLGPKSPWGRVLRVAEQARAAVLDEVRRRRAAGSAESDLLGLLISARHDDGAPLDDGEIRDEILTMVAAGHETTAMALTWLSYAVFTRSDVLARLQAERAAQPGADVDDLPYLDAVVRESLRMYSVVPVGSGRVAKQAFKLGGYDIPAGTMLAVAIDAVHRRAGVYDRPDEFRPERFLDKKYTPYEALPFGGGSRRCVGMAFALYEIKVVLSTLLEKFQLEVVQKSVRASWRGTFLTPSKGLQVRVREVRKTQRITPVVEARV